jgi:hydrogenase/urease accessory protein HupE
MPNSAIYPSATPPPLCNPAQLTWLLLVLCLAMVTDSLAHTIRPAVATVTVTEAGQIEVSVRSNAEALLAGIGTEVADTDDSPQAAQYDALRALPPEPLAEAFREFAPEFRVRSPLLADGTAVPLEFVSIDVPAVGDLELARDSTAYFQAPLPSASGELVWAWPADYGSSVIRFSQPGADTPETAWLQSGEQSEPYVLGDSFTERSRLAIIGNYIVIGFEHIVPKGLDHILFVVGIFLLSIHLRPLLLQVTAFTVAHTITLGLSIYGIISLPTSIVEPLIALSIAYVGIENILSPQLKPWRIALVFCFGLLHGMGFAGVLSEIGLPQSEFLTALISFNVGVEFGQLSVIAVCLLLVGYWRDRPWFRSVVVIPASLLISAVGLYWAWERTFG